MLPFLKNKNNQGIASIIVKNRIPDEKSEENQEDSQYSHDEAIKVCAKDLIMAIHARDEMAVADALREVFEKLEKLPHKEVEHRPEPHSYDAQAED